MMQDVIKILAVLKAEVEPTEELLKVSRPISVAETTNIYRHQRLVSLSENYAIRHPLVYRI